MSTTPPPAPASGPPAFTDSDQQWFDQLTGRAAGVTDAAAANEGAVLRSVLLRADVEAEADPALAADLSPEARQRRWEQIRFRRRRQQAGRPVTVPWWKHKRALGALAASVLAGVLIVGNLPDNGIYYDEPPTLRGEFVATVVPVARPRRSAEELSRRLQAAGQKSVLHQDGGRFTVDTVVEAGTPAAALDVLKAVGASGRLGTHRVEFVPR